MYNQPHQVYTSQEAGIVMILYCILQNKLLSWALYILIMKIYIVKMLLIKMVAQVILPALTRVQIIAVSVLHVPSSFVTLRPPPLDCETGCTGELWWKTNLLN